MVENTALLVKYADKTPKKQIKKVKIKDADEKIIKEPKKEEPKKPKDFPTEIRETSTEDLKLILDEQRDLYSDEEFKFIQDEYNSRF